MEGRCAVETLANFGFSGASCTPKVQFGGGTDVFICSGNDEVYVFTTKERKLTAILLFPDHVSDLVESPDKQLLYVSCRSGVYSVSLQFLLSRDQNSPAEASSTHTELKISAEFLAVAEEGVLSLLLVGSALLTLSMRDTSWVLTLYKSPEQSASRSYELLTSFSLPLVSGVLHPEKTAKGRRPVLLCVHSSDEIPHSSSSSSTSSSLTTLTDSDFHLESALFKLLFGVDAALAKSPVILCGLPDGRLCFLPLRVPGSRLRLLHRLEQPVVFVGGSCFMEKSPGCAQCLVAVGERGRAVLIKTGRGGPEGRAITTSFIERCVPGPVVCGCMDQDSFYFSTGSDLLRLDLTGGSSGKEGQERDEGTSRKTDAARQSPTSFNVCRVVVLVQPTRNTEGEVQLLGLSVRGQLQSITLPVWREGAGSSKLPPAQVGRSAPELLSAIGDVCERASMLKTAIRSKNQILRHLNHVLNISFLLTASTNDKDLRTLQEKPIRCHAATKWSRLLQKDSLNLACVLDNSSPYALERGWTLSITVLPLSHSPSQGGESSASFSFPFHNLHPGESLEVSLPLASAGDASFPVTVSCFLIFSLSSLVGEEAGDLPGSQSSCITLPLNTLTVDWLHALQVTGPIGANTKAASRCSSTASDGVQAFLRARWMSRGGRGGGGEESASEADQYSASVRVSSDLLHRTLALKSSGLDPQRPNVCLSLLEWLLCEDSGGVKTGNRGDMISNPLVLARCPNGHGVKMAAKEVHLEDERTRRGKESPVAVEVQVQSSSLAAVSGLHHAVLRRIQTLLQRAPERAASTDTIQSLGLRQALQRAEHLLQQIQQSRVSAVFGVGASTGQMTGTLLAVYRELRENPLLII